MIGKEMTKRKKKKNNTNNDENDQETNKWWIKERFSLRFEKKKEIT